MKTEGMTKRFMAIVGIGAACLIGIANAADRVDEDLVEELTGESPNPGRSIGELGPIYIDVLDSLSPRISSKSAENRAYSHGAISGMFNYVGNPGMDAQRRIFCGSVATVLENKDYPPIGRRHLIRGLGLVGGKECVGTLVELMGGSDSVEADLARMALQSVPGPESGKALVKALGAATTKESVLGLVDAVAARKLPDAVDSIAPLMNSEEAEIVLAASTALGQLGGSTATKVLGKARAGTADKKIQQEIELALIDIANQRGLSGDRDGAAKIFKVLGEQTTSPSVRAAAMLGLARAAPKIADSVVIEAIMSKDPRTRAAGIMTSTLVPSGRISKGLAAMLKTEPKDTKIQILNALTIKGDPSVLPEVLEFLESVEGKDNELELAAVRAIGPMGSTGNVELLLSKGVSKVPSIRDAALEALTKVRGKNIDQMIEFHAREGKSDDVRAVAIGLFMRDRNDSGLTRMMDFAKESNSTVSQAAFAVLRKRAGDNEFRGLLDLLASGKKSSYQVIKAVCARSKNPDLLAGEVDTRMRVAASTGQQRSMLSCLPLLGSPRGLSILVEYAGGEPAIAEPAKRALSKWPNEAALPEMLRIMEEQPENRIGIALMCAGIARLLPEAKDLTTIQKARYATEAFKLTKASRDQIVLLPVLGKIPHKDCAEIIEKMMTDRYAFAVAGSAAASLAELMVEGDPATATQLATALREKGRFNTALRSRAKAVLNKVGTAAPGA